MQKFTCNGSRTRTAFTWIELLVVIACIGILLGMLAPVTRGTREGARRATCLNNIRQIMLATHNFESAFEVLPPAMGGDHFVNSTSGSGSELLSGFVGILPFLDQQEMHETISSEFNQKGTTFESFPHPFLKDYPPWKVQLNVLSCPSAMRIRSDFGNSNYAFCIGDTARGIHNPTHQRGMFACKMPTTFELATDGASNTIAIAEMGTSSNQFLNSRFAINQPTSFLDNPSLSLELVDSDDPSSFAPKIDLNAIGRGGNWAAGMAGPALVNTILPPGSPSFVVDTTLMSDGIFSAGSFHHGSVMVGMGDGSVRGINEEIDAGDSTQSTLTPDEIAKNTESPFGVWGKLGSANGGESIEENAY